MWPVKGTISWERFKKCGQKCTELRLSKGRDWFLIFILFGEGGGGVNTSLRWLNNGSCNICQSPLIIGRVYFNNDEWKAAYGWVCSAQTGRTSKGIVNLSSVFEKNKTVPATLCSRSCGHSWWRGGAVRQADEPGDAPGQPRGHSRRLQRVQHHHRQHIYTPTIVLRLPSAAAFHVMSFKRTGIEFWPCTLGDSFLQHYSD